MENSPPSDKDSTPSVAPKPPAEDANKNEMAPRRSSLRDGAEEKKNKPSSLSPSASSRSASVLDIDSVILDEGLLPVLSKQDDFQKAVFALLHDQHDPSHNPVQAQVEEWEAEKASRSQTMHSLKSGLNSAPRPETSSKRSPVSVDSSTAINDGRKRSISNTVESSYGSTYLGSHQRVAARQAFLQAECSLPSGVDPYSLAGMEQQERFLIEHLAEEVFSYLQMDNHQARTREARRIKAEELGVPVEKVGHVDVPMEKEMTSAMKEMYVKSMFAFAESNFTDVFTEGISGTALNDEDVMFLVDAILTLPFMLDGDLEGFRLAWNPAMRLTAHSFPAEYLYTFHAYISAKAALSNAMSLVGDSIDAWRWKVIKFFYHPKEFHATEPRAVRIALMAFKHSQILEEVQPNSADGPDIIGDDLVAFGAATKRLFYQFCLAIENKYRQVYNADNDNTISVEYQRGEIVGSGGFGVVYRCINTETGRFLALKEVSIRKGADEGSFRVEIDTMKRLSHPNIVKYYGCRFDREAKKVSVLMEYLPKNLREVAVNSKGGLSLKLIATYAKQVLEGLSYLHSNMIIHRDIKAANVLVSESGEVKLTDFGTAMADTVDVQMNSPEMTDEELDKLPEAEAEELRVERHRKRMINEKNGKKHLAGTPLFMAPELLKGQLASEASDVWAFGCLLIELVTGRRPWVELQDDKDQLPPLEVLMYRLSSATSPPQIHPKELRESLPEEFLEVVNACLSLTPYSRPSAQALLKMTFFKEKTLEDRCKANGGHMVAGKCSYCSESNNTKRESVVGNSSSNSNHNMAAVGSLESSRTNMQKRSTEVVGPAATPSAGEDSSSGRSAPSSEKATVPAGRSTTFGDSTLMTESLLLTKNGGF